MSDRQYRIHATDYTDSRFAEIGFYEPGVRGGDELASFEEGDVVEYSDGNVGVITGVLTSDFDWPTGEDDETEVEASEDEPVYIVARETGGSKPFRGGDLSSATFDEDVDPAKLADEAEMGTIYHRMTDPNDEGQFVREYEELLNIPGVDDPGVGFSSLPDGWTRKSVLQAWASLGGTFTTCRAQMQGEIRSPKRFCAALKDEVLQTERWRGKF